jgi:hypothetical protein
MQGDTAELFDALKLSAKEELLNSSSSEVSSDTKAFEEAAAS